MIYSTAAIYKPWKLNFIINSCYKQGGNLLLNVPNTVPS
jgi:hypothetical protein